MARIISFIVLLAIVMLVGVLFIRVMAQFIVPLFLAVVLVVVFRPMHRWFVEHCRGRERIAAALTTLTILLIVLLPMSLLMFRAITDGIAIINDFTAEDQAALANNLQAQTNDLREWLADFGLVLPADQELINTAMEGVRSSFVRPAALGGAALGGAQFLIGFIIGLVIMIIAMYYFLVDGPAMIRTVMRLSPLDDRYEQELLDEFDRVSRAVVVASLLSALVQGLLAGIGYYFAGLQGVILLSGVTMLLALVPFVGAAAVWVPCSLWLFFFAGGGGRPAAAIALALYGMLVVSMIDNIIKPYILHGQSNLHPLLALLSVLGGVQVLGPIGILVGPMAVAFLQAVLNMLRSELDTLDAKTSKQPA
ncbi:MAG: AI-2E family transporter [Pirellulales bacterium]